MKLYVKYLENICNTVIIRLSKQLITCCNNFFQIKKLWFFKFSKYLQIIYKNKWKFYFTLKKLSKKWLISMILQIIFNSIHVVNTIFMNCWNLAIHWVLKWLEACYKLPLFLYKINVSHSRMSHTQAISARITKNWVVSKYDARLKFEKKKRKKNFFRTSVWF